jgi:4-amino-4-deoxy-L-arabinose transferase-like glycosyltransferase
MVDEGSFASAAKTLIDEGHLGTPQVQGLEDHLYWQPPVYFLSIAPVIKLAGYSLSVLRVWSLLIGIGLFIVLFFLTRSFAGPLAAKFAVLLLAFDPRFVNAIAYARMDGLCMLFVLWTLLFLLRPAFSRPRLNILLSGIFAMLASLTHAYGLAAPVAGLVALFLRSGKTHVRRWTDFAIFLFPLAFGIVLWGLYVVQDVPAFTEQMRFQFGRKSRPVMTALSLLIGHYRTYPMSLLIPVAGLAVLVWRGLKFRGMAIPIMVTHLAILIVALTKFEVPYHVYIAPLGAVGVALILAAVTNSRGRMIAQSFVILIMLNATAAMLILNYNLNIRLQHETDIGTFASAILQNIPQDGAVVCWGNPSIYWQSYRNRPDIRFRDAAFLNEKREDQVVSTSDFVITVRTNQPGQDGVASNMRRQYFETVCNRNSRTLTFVRHIGVDERFAYSADIFAITPSAK